MTTIVFVFHGCNNYCIRISIAKSGVASLLEFVFSVLFGLAIAVSAGISKSILDCAFANAGYDLIRHFSFVVCSLFVMGFLGALVLVVDAATLQYKNLAGFSFAELYTYNYSFVKSALNIEVATGLYLSGTVNVGNTGNTMGEMFDNFSNYSINRYYLGYSFGIKYESLLGPAQLLIADNNKHHKTEFLLSVGFPF